MNSIALHFVWSSRRLKTDNKWCNILKHLSEDLQCDFLLPSRFDFPVLTGILPLKQDEIVKCSQTLAVQIVLNSLLTESVRELSNNLRFIYGGNKDHMKICDRILMQHMLSLSIQAELYSNCFEFYEPNEEKRTSELNGFCDSQLFRKIKEWNACTKQCSYKNIVWTLIDLLILGFSTQKQQTLFTENILGNQYGIYKNVQESIFLETRRYIYIYLILSRLMIENSIQDSLLEIKETIHTRLCTVVESEIKFGEQFYHMDNIKPFIGAAANSLLSQLFGEVWEPYSSNVEANKYFERYLMQQHGWKTSYDFIDSYTDPEAFVPCAVYGPSMETIQSLQSPIVLSSAKEVVQGTTLVGKGVEMCETESNLVDVILQEEKINSVEKLRSLNNEDFTEIKKELPHLKRPVKIAGLQTAPTEIRAKKCQENKN